MASRTITWHSADGHWKVEGISVDTDGRGFQPRFRVWHDDIEHDGTLLLQQDREPDYHPMRGNSKTRIGPQYGAGGWILADIVWPAAEVEKFVPWGELEEICPVIPMRQHRKAA